MPTVTPLFTANGNGNGKASIPFIPGPEIRGRMRRREGGGVMMDVIKTEPSSKTAALKKLNP